MDIKKDELGVYALFDKVAERYGVLFEQPTHAAAIRSVKRNEIDRPEDYELIFLATIKEGVISPVESRMINWREKTGLEIKASKEKV